MGTLPHDILNLPIPADMDQRGAGSSLRTAFDDADEVRKAERAARRDKHHEDYNISTMDAGTRESTGRIGTSASAQSDREILARKRKKHERDNADLQVQLAAMQLQTFENGLIDQYGENFDLDLLGALTEDGHFSQEDYTAFASIEDPEERRRVIAQAIQDEIDAGEINPADLADHPWALEWLEKHEAALAEQSAKTQHVIKNISLSTTDVENGVADEVARESKNRDLVEQTRAARIEIVDSVKATDSGFSLEIPTQG